VEFTGERVTTDIMRPSHESYDVYLEHMARYQFCIPYVVDKAVLDAACGVGYGSATIAQFAAKVVGIELDEDAVCEAKRHYSKDNIQYTAMDCRRLAFSSGSFDVVVAFEFLEHIREQGQFLEEVVRVLNKDGLLIVSTPNREPYNALRDHPNHFHQNELSTEEFEDLVSRYFRRVEIYGQRRSRSFLRYQDMDRRIRELQLQVSGLNEHLKLLSQSLPKVFLRGLVPDSLLQWLPRTVLSRLHDWYRNRGIEYPENPIGENGYASRQGVSPEKSFTVEDIEISPKVFSDSVYLIAVCRR
jgi:SAM-dependent methyltransferase